jgi:hypothetical protein
MYTSATVRKGATISVLPVLVNGLKSCPRDTAVFDATVQGREVLNPSVILSCASARSASSALRSHKANDEDPGPSLAREIRSRIDCLAQEHLAPLKVQMDDIRTLFKWAESVDLSHLQLPPSVVSRS